MRKRKDESKIKKDIKPEKDLIIFSKDEFGDIRTLVINGKPYFLQAILLKLWVIQILIRLLMIIVGL